MAVEPIVRLGDCHCAGIELKVAGSGCGRRVQGQDYRRQQESRPISFAVLIVEDELLIAMALGQAVEDAGLRVAGMLASGEEAVEAVARLSPDVVVMDVRLAGRMDGIEAARIVRRHWQGPIVFHTAEGGARDAIAALGDTVLVPKPAMADVVAGVAADMARAAAPAPPLPPRREVTPVPAMD